MKDIFKKEGFSVVRSVLSSREAEELDASFQASPPAPPGTWRKGYPLSDKRFFNIGTTSSLLNPVRDILGRNVLLCGGVLLSREPGASHAWHCDMETGGSDGGFVTVWLGLHHISRDTVLQLIPGSHLFGQSVQRAAGHAGLSRDQLNAEAALHLAKQFDPDASLQEPDVQAGDAILFDGRMWHGSHNASSASRRAMLLHFALPEAPFREGDLTHLEGQIKFKPNRPPCIVISGGSDASVNEVVPTPVFSQAGEPELKETHGSLRIPFPQENEKPWTVRHLLHGSAPFLDIFSCHSSRLEPGACPHRPHRHIYEELICVVRGRVQLRWGRLGLRRIHLDEGDVVFLPRRCAHTLVNTSDQPAFYTICKWCSAHSDGPAAGKPYTGRFGPDPEWWTPPTGQGFEAAQIMEREAQHVKKLHLHRSRLAPGGGYEPHADAYNVVLIMLKGMVLTHDTTCRPFDVYFYPAGTLHGIRNIGNEPAEYLIVELHGV